MGGRGLGKLSFTPLFFSNIHINYHWKTRRNSEMICSKIKNKTAKIKTAKIKQPKKRGKKRGGGSRTSFSHGEGVAHTKVLR